MLFPEDFLHYLWKFRLFDRKELYTTSGEPLEIYSAGVHNFNSGPDFQNARVKIGDTVWAGNIEVHVASSDWGKHGHITDESYSSVILHVVYKDDEPLVLNNGRSVPTLELFNRIPDGLYQRYHTLIFGHQSIIPCEASIGKVDSLTMYNWFTRVLVERLEKRAVAVINALTTNRGDWEETFYQSLAANFGFKTNAVPFELLAKSLPQNILAKHKNNALQIEALIFGQAGFLDKNFNDDYPKILKSEYQFLQGKYKLAPVENHLWKFMRMRPQNFPTIRLAQFAALVISSNHLFSKVLDTREIEGLRSLFSDVAINPYWQTHFRFDVESPPSSKSLGSASVDVILLNTLATFLFGYGKYNQNQHFINRSIKLLENLPKETNNIIADFATLGVIIKTAFESQALIELKTCYCDYKQCLLCGIGNKILKLD